MIPKFRLEGDKAPQPAHRLSVHPFAASLNASKPQTEKRGLRYLAPFADSCAEPTLS